MQTQEDIKKLNDKELNEEINKAQFDLVKLRMAVSSRQSTSTAELKALRKYIARIKTIQRMRKMDQAPVKPAGNVIK